MKKIMVVVGIMLAILLLGGCGGGGSTAPSATNNQAIDGIWIGTLTSTSIATSYNIIGVVAPNNELRFTTAAGVQYIGMASVSGSNVTASITGLAPVGFTFLNGQNTTVGNINGTVVAGNTLNGTYTATNDNGNFTLSYSTTYNRPASLKLLAKTWSGSISSGAIVTVIITTGGVITGTDTLGCSYTGLVKVIDPAKNIYSTTLTASTCTMATTYKGLGILQDVAPAINNQLDFMVSNANRSVFGQLK